MKLFNFHHVIQIQEINFNKELTPTVHLTGKTYTDKKLYNLLIDIENIINENNVVDKFDFCGLRST